MPLSTIYSVLNGEKWLQESLSSVKDISDEIIIVDHGSTDKTLEIVKKFNVKVYKQVNDSSKIDLQKNFGFEKAKNDWILSIDSDEEITQELAQEIKELLKSNESTVNGYFIPRKNIIFGKWVEHTGWYPDYQLRLFRKGKGRFESKHFHENIKVEGKIDYINAHIIHHNYEKVSDFFLRNILVYAPNEAEHLQNKGYEFSYADSIKFPLKEFLSRFFAREGYKDGFLGLMLSLGMAFYHFAIFTYLWEKNKFPENNDPLEILAKESKDFKKEYSYWSTTTQIKKEKNPAKKFLQKFKRKLSL